jgi:hypothetical protein
VDTVTDTLAERGDWTAFVVADTAALVPWLAF